MSRPKAIPSSEFCCFIECSHRHLQSAKILTVISEESSHNKIKIYKFFTYPSYCKIEN